MALTSIEAAQQQALAEGYQNGPTPTLNSANLNTQSAIGNPLVPVIEPVPYFPPITISPNLGLTLIGLDGTEAQNMVLIDAAIGIGGAVSSVFGRVGTIIAEVPDYSAFYDLIGASATAQSNAETFASSLLGVTLENYVSWNPGTVNANSMSTFNISIRGVRMNIDAVSPVIPSALPAGILVMMYVSVSDIVTIVVANVTGVNITFSSALTWGARIVQ